MKNKFYYHVAAYLPDGSIHAWEQLTFADAKETKAILEMEHDNGKYKTIRIIKTTNPTL